MGMSLGSSWKINMYYVVFICYPLIYNLSICKLFALFLLLITIAYYSKSNRRLTNVFCVWESGISSRPFNSVIPAALSGRPSPPRSPPASSLHLCGSEHDL